MKLVTLALLILFSQNVYAGSSPTEYKQFKEVVNELVTGTVKTDDCGIHSKARELAQLIIHDANQKRIRLKCNPILARVAAEKAQEMAEKGMVSHYAGYVGANRRLVEAGYSLPAHYPTLYHNQVEAVAGGYTSAIEVWDELKGSSAHRAHMLGEHSFYLEQDEIGVAFYRKWDSPHVEYWVVYIATQSDKSKTP